MKFRVLYPKSHMSAFSVKDHTKRRAEKKKKKKKKSETPGTECRLKIDRSKKSRVFLRIYNHGSIFRSFATTA